MFPPYVPGRPPLIVPPNSVRVNSRATRMLPPWKEVFVVPGFALISPVLAEEQSQIVMWALNPPAPFGPQSSMARLLTAAVIVCPFRHRCSVWFCPTLNIAVASISAVRYRYVCVVVSNDCIFARNSASVATGSQLTVAQVCPFSTVAASEFPPQMQ